MRTLPPLDVTLVPIAFESENSRVDNAPVAALVADLATSNSHPALQETQVVLPLSELNISVREPYTTQADTVEEGGFGLLDEIHLLRFIEAGAAPTTTITVSWPCRPRAIGRRGALVASPTSAGGPA